MKKLYKILLGILSAVFSVSPGYGAQQVQDYNSSSELEVKIKTAQAQGFEQVFFFSIIG